MPNVIETVVHDQSVLEPDYSAVMYALEQDIACTWLQEELLYCPDCGFLTLAREHFLLVHDNGHVAEWGHADRCWTCEPFVSHMPSVVHEQQMRARAVV